MNKVCTLDIKECFETRANLEKFYRINRLITLSVISIKPIANIMSEHNNLLIKIISDHINQLITLSVNTKPNL
jgi:hypothetical protein